jgi:hypothetical protein
MNYKKQKSRTIEKVCIQSKMYFQTQIGDFKYCSIAMRKGKIDCPYLGKKDDNGLYLCKNLLEKEKSFN